MADKSAPPSPSSPARGGGGVSRSEVATAYWVTGVGAVIALGAATAASLPRVGTVAQVVVALVPAVFIAVGWPRLVSAPAARVTTSVSLLVSCVAAGAALVPDTVIEPTRLLAATIGLLPLAAFIGEMARGAERFQMVTSLGATVSGGFMCAICVAGILLHPPGMLVLIIVLAAVSAVALVVRHNLARTLVGLLVLAGVAALIWWDGAGNWLIWTRPEAGGFDASELSFRIGANTYPLALLLAGAVALVTWGIVHNYYFRPVPMPVTQFNIMAPDGSGPVADPRFEPAAGSSLGRRERLRAVVSGDMPLIGDPHLRCTGGELPAGASQPGVPASRLEVANHPEELVRDGTARVTDTSLWGALTLGIAPVTVGIIAYFAASKAFVAIADFFATV